MNLTKQILMTIIIIAELTACSKQSSRQQEIAVTKLVDPLPSWQDGTLKQSIIAYVKTVTDSSNKNFIPAEHRNATFDNDGTLWAERPYVQEMFANYQVKKMVEKNPSLANKQPYKAVLSHDKIYFEKGGEKALIELLTATHTGMNEDEFELSVKNFFTGVTYPKLNVPAKQITYRPQIELLNYLRENGFRTYICTGGTVEFVRSISKEFYGIPKDQVIGSSFQYEFIDSSNTLYRKGVLSSFNDKLAKPANIQLHIGERPVFACGNEGGGGDIAMLEFSQSSSYPSFQMIINHDDSLREFYYQEKDSASLIAAAKNKWHVVSMKNDWREIFTK